MKTLPSTLVALCFSASLIGLLGCAGKPSKKIQPVVQQYDVIGDAIAAPMKRGMDKVGSGDMKGAVDDLELCMAEMAKVSAISIEGCPDDFIMAWGSFAAKHDEARKAIGQFVVSTKNSSDSDDPIAGLAKMLLGGGATAALQFQQVTKEMQNEASKLKVICSKYGVDGSALDVVSRIEAVEDATP